MASRDEWARRVARWKKSRLSGADFAEREGLNAGTLGWWRSRLRRPEPKEPKPKPATGLMPQVSFVEVKAIEIEEPVAERIEVSLANGRVVRVPTAFDDEALRRVLLVAEGA